MRLIKYVIVAAAVFLLIGCDNNSTQSTTDKYSGVIEGVDFDELFAEPREAEINNVKAQWNSESITLTDTEIIDTTVINIGYESYSLQVVATTNENNVKHYSALIFPPDTLEEYEVLFYNHGGDNGINIQEFLSISDFSQNMRTVVSDRIIAIPSFRSEALINVDSTVYQSTGDPSPWDKDIQDCMAVVDLIEKEYKHYPISTINALGISRGAGVSMLWSARDPRVHKVVSFFGPTDLISDWTKEITYNALKGNLEDLPGLDYLNNNIITPLKEQKVSIEMARHELIKRSAVYFLEHLLPLQIHHGKEDQVIPVEQAEIMIKKASDLGVSESEFQGYIHEYSGHDENTLLKGLDEMAGFLLAN